MKKYNKKSFKKKTLRKKSFRKQSYKKKYLKGGQFNRENEIKSYAYQVYYALSLDKFSKEELDAYYNAIVICAKEILRRWDNISNPDDNVYPFDTNNRRKFDVHAACTLARKTILGYDANYDFYKYYKTQKKSGKIYAEWIMTFLKNNNWRACWNTEKYFGHLPTDPQAQEAALKKITTVRETQRAQAQRAEAERAEAERAEAERAAVTQTSRPPLRSRKRSNANVIEIIRV